MLILENLVAGYSARLCSMIALWPCWGIPGCGVIRWCGQDLLKMPAHAPARAGLGRVPQEREIFRSLSVEENLTVTALPGKWYLQAVYALFPRLQERRKNFGNQLSGGEQQMLAIGRAQMLNPKLLLLDEPLEALAPVIVDEPCSAASYLSAAAWFMRPTAPICWRISEYSKNGSGSVCSRCRMPGMMGIGWQSRSGVTYQRFCVGGGCRGIRSGRGLARYQADIIECNKTIKPGEDK